MKVKTDSWRGVLGPGWALAGPRRPVLGVQVLSGRGGVRGGREGSPAVMPLPGWSLCVVLNKSVPENLKHPSRPGTERH